MYLIPLTTLLALSATASPLILVDHPNGSAVNFDLFGVPISTEAGLAESGPNCAAIGCLVELCPNGQMPPVPAGGE